MPHVAEWNYTGTDKMSQSTIFLATGFECLRSLACASSKRAASPKHGLRNIRHCQASRGRAAIAEDLVLMSGAASLSVLPWGHYLQGGIRLAFSWANQYVMRSSLNLARKRCGYRLLSIFDYFPFLTTLHSLFCEAWSFHYFDDT